MQQPTYLVPVHILSPMEEKEISVEDFIKTRKDILKLTAIERKIKMPYRTLQNVVDGRNVPDKYRKALIHYLKSITEKINLK